MKSQRWARRVDEMFHKQAGRIAWIFALLAVVFGVLFLLLLVHNSADPRVDTYDYWLASAIMALVFPVVGALILSRYPANALGWVFCVIGFFTGIGDFASEYLTYTLVVQPGSLPGGGVAAWVSTYASDAGFLSVVLIPLLFPDGRPASRRWRPVVWLATGAVAVAAISLSLMPIAVGEYPPVENPLGIEGAAVVLQPLSTVAFQIAGISLLAGIVSLILRYRRSRGTERQQVKWFTFAIILVPVSLLGNTLFPDFAWLIGGVSAALIPVALGIAILKYHLYDIDIVINRTLVYGALTACVVGFYVLVVGYLGAQFQTGDNLAISLVVTALVAVLFQPLRDRLQRGVNRLMYGERDEPHAVLARLGQHLERTLVPQAMLPAIVETVAQALKLPYVAIALKQDETFAVAAAYGVERPAHALIMPLTYQSEMVGQLSVAPRSEGESFSPADQRILSTIAQQIGVVAHAVSLTADLQRSRERLVTAREEERRR
ncbi:MAG: histidine kinase, partial [Chloroflexia bacterium]|nr:histidine kinase [Chloroflexia bacterium]